MRRRTLLVAVHLVLALAPMVAEAQPRLMGGVGLSTPFGDLADDAEVGWHALAGLQLGFPTLPVALRADGAYHSFGEASPSPKTNMLSGHLSVVVILPGVGLSPYLLGGVGMHRTSVDGQEAESDSGFHGAFGVDIGALGFGGFGEARVVSINRAEGDARFVTFTIGFRL
jgi:hypothetical protein